MTETTHPQPVRVLVVDDQRVVCDGIASLLSLQANIAVVGTAANGQEALAQVAALQPDVVLMDIRMPVMNGIEATQQIRTRFPNSQALVLTTFDDEALIVDALGAGAVGYLLKNIPAPTLAQAILAAHSHMFTFEHVVAGKVVAVLHESRPMRAPDAADAHHAAAHPSSELTSRELEVLRLIAQGASNREIASALVVSESTVKAHISSILSRLHVRDRTQAALYARDRGWV